MRDCVLFAWIVGILVFADIIAILLVAGTEEATLADIAFLQAFAQFRMVWILLAILACLVALVKEQERRNVAVPKTQDQDRETEDQDQEMEERYDEETEEEYEDMRPLYLGIIIVAFIVFMLIYKIVSAHPAY